ncbi:hypothetical protein BU14_0887s0007 [Porphyra umbilicalis]|uniref:Uncharacterized protein n=1 Tax=Porphyra umbilicalis TaxID=2786 RepID=A0A1X6NP75_PORUM|nr:hypothetical protein BU14_0887s0007 [Porphyra umbilicalis]|eukprot:OSX70143.1 hypothetical protein BU14_0887s0007 [Porphyra umbilicalis]
MRCSSGPRQRRATPCPAEQEPAAANARHRDSAPRTPASTTAPTLSSLPLPPPTARHWPTARPHRRPPLVTLAPRPPPCARASPRAGAQPPPPLPPAWPSHRSCH